MRSLVVVVLLLFSTALAGAGAVSFSHLNVGASFTACPYPASSSVDGCASAVGSYFSPASGDASFRTRPTAGQWGAYARQSGQSWPSDHPQAHNVAGVDYGTGPSVPVSSLSDVAGFGTNGTNTDGTCTYYATFTIVANWAANNGGPVLYCQIAADQNYTLSGYNFGATAFQGSPSGSHGCVNLVIVPTTGSAPRSSITVSGNAFINGVGCAPQPAGGIRYGMISSMHSPNNISVTIQNNYIDGQNQSGCCSMTTWNMGFVFASSGLQANFDFNNNFVLNAQGTPLVLNFGTGSESFYPCSNGTAYTNAGFNASLRNNYIDGFGYTYGEGHWEMATLNPVTGSTLCSFTQTYNTILYPNTVASEGASTFFNQAGGFGTVELSKADHNTIVTNLLAGKTWPNVIEYYNWTSNGGSPNQVQITGTGTGCSTTIPLPGGGTAAGSCSGAIRGQAIWGGTGNDGSTLGLQSYNSGTGLWNAGCNANAGAGKLCYTAINYAGTGQAEGGGNFPALNPGISLTVSNSYFSNKQTSMAGGQADHGPASPPAGSYAYGAIIWTNNFIDGTGSNASSIDAIPTYWEANPNAVAGGYQNYPGTPTAGGGCAQPTAISGNIELRAGLSPSGALQTALSGLVNSATLLASGC